MNNIWFSYRKDHYGPGKHLGPQNYFKDYDFSEELITKFNKLLDKVNDNEIGWIVRGDELSLIVKGHIRTLTMSFIPSFESEIDKLSVRIDVHLNFLSKDKPTLRDLKDVIYDVHDGQREKTGILLDCFENNGSGITDKEYWKLIMTTWSYGDFNSLCPFRKSNWRDLFKLRKRLTSFLDFFEEEVLVYRGGNSKKGVSWTLSKDVGELFQRDNDQHNYKSKKKSKLYQMKIKKTDILFFSNFRQELEVVVLPKKGRKTFHQEITELELSDRTMTEIKTQLGHYEGLNE